MPNQKKIMLKKNTTKKMDIPDAQHQLSQKYEVDFRNVIDQRNAFDAAQCTDPDLRRDLQRLKYHRYMYRFDSIRISFVVVR